MDRAMHLEDYLNEMSQECEKYETCMSLYVCREGRAVELCLDTGIGPTHHEWIEGEGADISLIRCTETNRVVGVRLPLMVNRLCVQHDGPIRINAGFLKSDSQ